ncbi:MAG: GNAT family N-acetyltransferase [Halieaceae bacterium]|jgi:RimJ/RimL family protein N-acetyltransferase|nr:GNAT family N-acetyltransferase [Halieaceae bacterium]
MTPDIQPTLHGPTLTLRPTVAEDFAALCGAASDPAIWTQHPDSERYKREVFRQRYFNGALESAGALTILHSQHQRIIGCSRYYEWQPQKKSIAIGYTFIQRAYWGTGTNGELKDLMLRHIAQWADTVWFHVGESNLRSRRAVEKLGAKLSHREAREQHGKHFNQLYYLLDLPSFLAHTG